MLASATVTVAVPTPEASLCATEQPGQSELTVHLTQPSGVAASWVVQYTNGRWWSWASQQKVPSPDAEATEGIMVATVPTKGAERLRVRAYALSASGASSAWSAEVAVAGAGLELSSARRVRVRIIVDGGADDPSRVRLVLLPAFADSWSRDGPKVDTTTAPLAPPVVPTPPAAPAPSS